jgi:hypothetical protein
MRVGCGVGGNVAGGRRVEKVKLRVVWFAVFIVSQPGD